MSTGVRVEYGYVTPNAKENFKPMATDVAIFANIEQLMTPQLIFPNYGNPCEQFETSLDGNSVVLPSNPNKANLGLWSSQLSGSDGIFDEPIVLTLTSAQKYTIPGISLLFDVLNDIYANHINIQFYEGDILLDDEDFYPNSSNWHMEKIIQNLNKIVITFYSLNMPYNRLNLRVIEYGYGIMFGSDSLRSVKIIQEINPVSSEISINTADILLDTGTQGELLFQKKQPLSIYRDEQLKATVFVEKTKRKSQRLWSFSCNDYIGLLEGVSFVGGMYVNKNASDLVAEIFSTAKIPYELDGRFAEVIVSGYIPYTNCREALMQVAFAIQAMVDTSNSDVVKIYEPNDEVTQTVALSRIMEGQSFERDDVVTAVEVSAHFYRAISEEAEVYNAENDGIGDNIFIKFNEPLHSLNIINGEILAFGVNYAKINAFVGCLLTGLKYEHTTVTKRKDNPRILANDIENIVIVDNATLVSASNVDKVLERCYNYYANQDSAKMKIVESKHNIDGEIIYDKVTNVGDMIKFETSYSGEKTGRIIKQTFNLAGGITIKDTVVR